MRTDKLPDSVLGGRYFQETLFKAIIWFIGGDDEILFDGRRSSNRFKAALFFIKSRNIGHDKPGFHQCSLNTIPDCRTGIGKFHRHPVSWLQNPVSLFETGGHYLSVFV